MLRMQESLSYAGQAGVCQLHDGATCPTFVTGADWSRAALWSLEGLKISPHRHRGMWEIWQSGNLQLIVEGQTLLDGCFLLRLYLCGFFDLTPIWVRKLLNYRLPNSSVPLCLRGEEVSTRRLVHHSPRRPHPQYRSCEQQRVNPVEHPAMARKQRSGVFHARAALDQ